MPGRGVNPQTGAGEWVAGGFYNPQRIAGTVPESAGNVGPNYNERLEQMSVNRRDEFFGGFPQGADNQAVGKEYNRILAERMANETMNRQQQAEQGRALVNPLPSRLSTADRQQYINQHPLSEAAPLTSMGRANQAVMDAMARANAGGGGAAPTPAETRASLESIGQPVPEDVLAATGGPGEAQAPAFVGQLRSSATELAGMTTKQEYDDLIQRLSAGENPETVTALKKAGGKYVAEINPRLGRQIADTELVEAKNESAVAGWFRANVDKAPTKSDAELYKQTMEDQKLKSRFALEVGEIAGPGGVMLPLTPEIRDVLSYELPPDLENTPYTDPKTGITTTAKAVKDKAQQNISASLGMSREARAAVLYQEMKVVNDVQSAIATRLNVAQGKIDSGELKDVVAQTADASPKISKASFNEAKARIGDQNLAQMYAPTIQSATVNRMNVLDKSGLIKESARLKEESEATADLVKYYPGVGIKELTGQVISDLRATIDKKKPMSADQLQAAVETSMTRVLKGNNKQIDVFSEEAGARVVSDLEDAVKKRLGDEWREISERADKELVDNKLRPMLVSAQDDMAIAALWDEQRATSEFNSITGLLSDQSEKSKTFIQQLDINESGRVGDSPQELAAYWLVTKRGPEFIPLARQLANGSFRLTGDRAGTQGLYNEFQTLVGKFSGGMMKAGVAATKKVDEELRTMPSHIVNTYKTIALATSGLSKEARDEAFIRGGLPQFDVRNIKGNLLERSGKEYWYATNELKVEAAALDDVALAAFNNAIGSRGGFIGWSNDINTRRGVVAATSGRVQDLTAGSDPQYSREWGAEKDAANIANAKEAERLRIKGGVEAIKKMKVVYPKGLDEIINNNPNIKSLIDLGTIRQATGEDTSGKLIDLAVVMATEQFRGMQSAVMDAGIKEIRRNIALKTSPDIAYKLADVYEGFDLAEEGMPGFGKAKNTDDVVSRIRQMVYQDGFTNAELIELKDQYEMQAKIASKSKGDRTRQKLNFGGSIDSKTLDGYEHMANEIVAMINDKLNVPPSLKEQVGVANVPAALVGEFLTYPFSTGGQYQRNEEMIRKLGLESSKTGAK
jgi:hypothetical protein